MGVGGVVAPHTVTLTPIRNDARTPRSIRRQDPVVQHGVLARARYQGRQACKKIHRFVQHMRGAVMPRSFQAQRDTAVIQDAQALAREGWSRAIAYEVLEGSTTVRAMRRDRQRAMEIESIERHVVPADKLLPGGTRIATDRLYLAPARAPNARRPMSDAA